MHLEQCKRRHYSKGTRVCTCTVPWYTRNKLGVLYTVQYGNATLFRRKKVQGGRRWRRAKIILSRCTVRLSPGSTVILQVDAFSLITRRILACCNFKLAGTLKTSLARHIWPGDDVVINGYVCCIRDASRAAKKQRDREREKEKERFYRDNSRRLVFFPFFFPSSSSRLILSPLVLSRMLQKFFFCLFSFMFFFIYTLFRLWLIYHLYLRNQFKHTTRIREMQINFNRFVILVALVVYFLISEVGKSIL